MTETRESPQHSPAPSVSDADRKASEGRSAKAIALIGYAQALQEYLEEQLPGLWPGRIGDKPVISLSGQLMALEALGWATSLLSAVGSGKQLDVGEFEAVLTRVKAAFAESGVLAGDNFPPMNSQSDGETGCSEGCGWTLPRWCAEKLCDGLEELSSEAANGRRTET